MDKYKKILLAVGIRPTYERLRILRYLYEHSTHPTVATIVQALQKTIPTISKTTVYNTVNLLDHAGLISIINIAGDEIHFDGDTNPHQHFYCERCKKIYDITIPDMPKISSFFQNHKVKSMHCYIRGICENCLKKQLKMEEK